MRLPVTSVIGARDDDRPVRSRLWHKVRLAVAVALGLALVVGPRHAAGFLAGAALGLFALVGWVAPVALLVRLGPRGWRVALVALMAAWCAGVFYLGRWYLGFDPWILPLAPLVPFVASWRRLRRLAAVGDSLDRGEPLAPDLRRTVRRLRPRATVAFALLAAGEARKAIELLDGWTEPLDGCWLIEAHLACGQVAAAARVADALQASSPEHGTLARARIELVDGEPVVALYLVDHVVPDLEGVLVDLVRADALILLGQVGAARRALAEAQRRTPIDLGAYAQATARPCAAVSASATEPGT